MPPSQRPKVNAARAVPIVHTSDDDPQRQEMPTLTDPVELEAARVISTFTSPPPAIEVELVDVPDDVLLLDYERRLGPFTRVPSLGVARETLATLTLDPRAAFVLSLVDGSMRVVDIL